ncbi:MAG TPA: secondary thiamine-phosphate synthase enzyme YjbQ [Bryobacterales bacterium]|jgi:secondary thiamine-phosphate synthase enzyme|nr:secondary thiamine-phosphate synthase enzyme YjbQ [Bryobacterales bacterium]
MLQKLKLQTTARTLMLDVTGQVQKAVERSGVRSGLACIFTPHTTAGVVINEHDDPDVARDILSTLEKLVPRQGDYRHYEENSDSHIKSALAGCSQTVIIEEGRLLLGTWQGVFFCEFDGPRQRELWIKII